MAWLALLAALSQAPPTIVGQVVDSIGGALPGARVTLLSTTSEPRGLVTDSAGTFRAIAPVALPFTIEVALDGFDTVRVVVERPLLDSLRVVLPPQPQSESVAVVAPKPPPSPEGFALRPLDVVRTPGTQADLFRAVQMLPGVVNVDEGAGLFVRGGDVSETAVLLDGVTLAHPYRYESPTGGFSGFVDVFQLDETTFEQGAFPARYGGALSGVLDLRTLGRPDQQQFTVSGGLAGASMSLAQPVGDRFGVRLATNRTWTKLLFAVNTPPRQFSHEPDGWDLRLSAHADLGTRGTLKASLYGQGDRVGVETPRDAFRGFLTSAGRQTLGTLHWEVTPDANTIVRAALGRDAYSRSVDVGSIALDTIDYTTTVRIDVQRRVEGAEWRSGIDLAPASTHTSGVVSLRGSDLEGVSGTIPFDATARSTRAGLYVEREQVLFRSLVGVGARVEHFSRERTTVLDPRVSVGLPLTSTQRLRMAWGIYHQAPKAAYYDAFRGADTLRPLRSAQYVVGYETGGASRDTHVRIEAYRKRYSQLPLQRVSAGYDSTGYGHANGVDVYAKRGWSALTLTGSYSYLQARRRWTSSEQFQRYPTPDTTWRPDFEIPHSASVVAEGRLSDGLTTALAWRHASGRPATPVVGVEPRPEGLLPVYGAINSERLPAYDRLDGSVSLARPFRNGLMVMFGGVSNITGRRNGFEYSYAPDYQSRELIVTTSPRSAYVGVSLIQ